MPISIGFTGGPLACSSSEERDRPRTAPSGKRHSTPSARCGRLQAVHAGRRRHVVVASFHDVVAREARHGARRGQARVEVEHLAEFDLGGRRRIVGRCWCLFRQRLPWSLGVAATAASVRTSAVTSVRCMTTLQQQVDGAIVAPRAFGWAKSAHDGSAGNTYLAEPSGRRGTATPAIR